MCHELMGDTDGRKVNKAMKFPILVSVSSGDKQFTNKYTPECRIQVPEMVQRRNKHSKNERL